MKLFQSIILLAIIVLNQQGRKSPRDKEVSNKPRKEKRDKNQRPAKSSKPFKANTNSNSTTSPRKNKPGRPNKPAKNSYKHKNADADATELETFMHKAEDFPEDCTNLVSENNELKEQVHYMTAGIKVTTAKTKQELYKEPLKARLMYFNGRGLAEAIRISLFAAGLTFEDRRVTNEEWKTIKYSEETTYTRKLPVLKFNYRGQDVLLSESTNILLWIQHTLLSPHRNRVHNAESDQYLFTLQDLATTLSKHTPSFDYTAGALADSSDADKMQALTDSSSAVYEAFLFWNNLLKDNMAKKSKWLTGAKVNVADFKLFTIVDQWFVSGWQKEWFARLLQTDFQELNRLNQQVRKEYTNYFKNRQESAW